MLARQFDYPYLQVGEGKFSAELVAAYQPFSQQVEQLRAVRSQLMLRWFARGRRSLAIIEIDADDGASLFAANLAVVFSQLGEHTVLVDANLRTPRQKQVFDLQNRAGLSDILAGRADLSAITKVESFVDLSVLAAGTLPPNPQELLSRSSFRALNTQLQDGYDVVLYDVAPFASGADALAVAVLAGGVLLVARRNKTALDAIGAMRDKIAQAGAEVVGAVLVDF